MILKSYLVEQNVEILKSYHATIIYGVNNGIKDDIKEQIKEQNKDVEIVTFFESDIAKKELLYENIANQSLFSSKKIIFIQEASDKIFNEISACLEREIKEIQIYIFSENLERKSKLRNFFEKDKKLASIACYEDNERTLLNYINKELKNFRGLTGEITNLIIINSNLDRKIIKNELIKIKTFFTEKKINKDQIIEILNIKNDGGFDEIRDKALIGEKLKVNKLLSETEILSDEAFFYLNTLNYRVMRLHEIIKSTKNTSDYKQTLESLKPPFFWKDKPIILQQLKRWSLNQIEELLFKIAEAEILMKKNSYIKNNIIIKNLIINLTNKASTSF